MSGDIWAVPPTPAAEWPTLSQTIWRDVERVVRSAYPGRCRQVLRIDSQASFPAAWLTYPIAIELNAMGAPVAQLFTACRLAQRIGL